MKRQESWMRILHQSTREHIRATKRETASRRAVAFDSKKAQSDKAAFKTLGDSTAYQEALIIAYSTGRSNMIIVNARLATRRMLLHMAADDKVKASAPSLTFRSRRHFPVLCATLPSHAISLCFISC